MFISTHSESTEDASSNQRKLGFTISFPVDQVSASSGTGIKWKSLSVDDTVEFPQPFMSLSVTFFGVECHGIHNEELVQL